MAEQLQTECNGQLTDVNAELERQRNDCDTLRDKLRQQQVTLASFCTQSSLSLTRLMLESTAVMSAMPLLESSVLVLQHTHLENLYGVS